MRVRCIGITHTGLGAIETIMAKPGRHALTATFRARSAK